MVKKLTPSDDEQVGEKAAWGKVKAALGVGQHAYNADVQAKNKSSRD